jgi:HK97 family phage portal protein
MPIVPASEIIHDLMVPFFHPLLGVSPIYACGTAALQGLNIQENSTRLFGNATTPSGIITAPGDLTQEQVDQICQTWITKHSGANFASTPGFLTNGMKWEPTTMNAVDAQLIQQLAWTVENICGCFGMPIFMIDSSKTPPYANSEPMTQQYYSQTLQTQIGDIEAALDHGLGLGPEFGNTYGTEFDIDDLRWLDTATNTKAANESVGSGAMSPNEARKKYFGLGPVEGGGTPYMQQQYWALSDLAQRGAAPAPPPIPAAPDQVTKSLGVDLAAFEARLRREVLADAA